MITHKAYAAWHGRILPTLTDQEILTLYKGLMYEPEAIVQGATYAACKDEGPQFYHVKGACALGYIVWKTQSLDKIDQVMEAFYKLVDSMDSLRVSCPGVGYFVEWFDNERRDDMIEDMQILTGAAVAERGIDPQDNR